MAYTYRFSTLLLLLTLPACELKDGGDDTGATGDEAGGTTTGEVTTSGGDSDPTTPATDPSASGTTATGTATAGTSTATAGTSSGDPTVSTTGDDTSGTTGTSGMTTVATSTSTSADTGDTDVPPDPVDPPVPCAGEATPLVGITTTIGYLQSQVPPRQDPTGGGTSTTGGGDLDPGTLFVKLSDQAFTCADPNALLECGSHWEVTIVIPPEFQSPGIHNLLGQDVRGTAIETGVDEGMNSCGFGGGSFGATFEILAIDDQVVEGRLCNVEDFFFFSDPQLEGSFTATRCPL